METENASNEQPTGTVSAGTRFLPAFGKAALLLGLFALGLVLMGQPMLAATFDAMAENAADGGDGVKGLQLSVTLGLWIVAVVCGLSAVVLGLLSLFGVGKADGRSHRVSGFFGMTLGGMVACMPLLLLPAIDAARRAAIRHAVQQELDALDTGAQQLTCANGAVVLRRPGDDWVILDGKAAARMHQNASLVAMKAIPGPEPIYAMIMVAHATVEELGMEDPRRLPQWLQDTAQQVVNNSQWTERSSPTIESGLAEATPYVEYRFEGLNQGGVRYETVARMAYIQGYLVDLIAIAPSEFPGRSDDWAKPFFRSVSLHQPSE